MFGVRTVAKGLDKTYVCVISSAASTSKERIPPRLICDKLVDLLPENPVQPVPSIVP